jgi:hypothetical protein
MTRFAAITLLLLPLVLTSCSSKQDSKSTQPPPQATTSSPAQATPTPPARKGRALVTKLPKGLEGVELADGGLKLKDGYEFRQEKDGTLSIARMQDPHPTPPAPRVWCKCSGGGGTCKPGSQGPLAVCVTDSACTNCVLGVTFGGADIDLFMY